MERIMEGSDGRKSLRKSRSGSISAWERRPEGFALFCSSGEFCRRPCRAEDSFRQRERP